MKPSFFSTKPNQDTVGTIGQIMKEFENSFNTTTDKLSVLNKRIDTLINNPDISMSAKRLHRDIIENRTKILNAHSIIKKLKQHLITINDRIASSSLNEKDISDIHRTFLLSCDFLILFEELFDEEKLGVDDPEDYKNKLQQLNSVIKHLPGNGNELLADISTVLWDISLAFINLSAYFFLYITISHGALFASTAFTIVAFIILGISSYLQANNQKSELVSIFNDLIDSLHSTVTQAEWMINLGFYNGLTYANTSRKSSNASSNYEPLTSKAIRNRETASNLERNSPNLEFQDIYDPVDNEQEVTGISPFLARKNQIIPDDQRVTRRVSTRSHSTGSDDSIRTVDSEFNQCIAAAINDLLNNHQTSTSGSDSENESAQEKGYVFVDQSNKGNHHRSSTQSSIKSDESSLHLDNAFQEYLLIHTASLPNENQFFTYSSDSENESIQKEKSVTDDLKRDLFFSSSSSSSSVDEFDLEYREASTNNSQNQSACTIS